MEHRDETRRVGSRTGPGVSLIGRTALLIVTWSTTPSAQPGPVQPAESAASAPSGPERTAVAAPAPGQLSDRLGTERLASIEAGPLASRELATAEAELIAAAEQCLDCGPELQARFWLLLGVTRGMRADEKGAVSAFRRAFTLDPSIQLEAAYATDPETVIIFLRVQNEVSRALAGRTPPVSARPPTLAEERIPVGSEPGTLECTPEFRFVEVLRPIPIHCVQQDPNQPRPARMEVMYREYDSARKWARIRMNLVKEGYQATIPCRSTQRIGKLEVLIRGYDEQGREVEYLGDATTPLIFEVRNFTNAPPPRLPGRPPPLKCEPSEQCPPGIPGCVAGSSTECESDADCLPGRCDLSGICKPRECRHRADCTPGTACVRGSCTEFNPPRHRLSAEMGYDLAIAGGTGVCRPREGGRDFACFEPGGDKSYVGIAQPGNSGETSFGLVPSTLRFLLDYEMLLGRSWSIGARAGIAILGEPDLGRSRFLPFHAELRGRYFLFTPEARLRPLVLVAGGIATVDARFDVEIVDCGVPESETFDAGCATSTELQDPTRVRKLDAVQRFGPGFVSVGVGALLRFGLRNGLRLEAAYSQFFGAAGGVVSPSAGFYQSF